MRWVYLKTLNIFQKKSPKKFELVNWHLQKSNERKETERKTGFFFQKSSTFEFRRKKYMTLKLFEFEEKFFMDFFLLKLTQFEKTRSTGKTFISLGNLVIKIHFQN